MYICDILYVELFLLNLFYLYHWKIRYVSRVSQKHFSIEAHTNEVKIIRKQRNISQIRFKYCLSYWTDSSKDWPDPELSWKSQTILLPARSDHLDMSPNDWYLSLIVDWVTLFGKSTKTVLTILIIHKFKRIKLNTTSTCSLKLVQYR